MVPTSSPKWTSYFISQNILLIFSRYQWVLPTSPNFLSWYQVCLREPPTHVSLGGAESALLTSSRSPSLSPEKGKTLLVSVHLFDSIDVLKLGKGKHGRHLDQRWLSMSNRLRYKEEVTNNSLEKLWYHVSCVECMPKTLIPPESDSNDYILHPYGNDIPSSIEADSAWDFLNSESIPVHLPRTQGDDVLLLRAESNCSRETYHSRAYATQNAIMTAKSRSWEG